MDMRIEHRAGVDCGTGCGRKRRESGEGRTLNLKYPITRDRSSSQIHSYWSYLSGLVALQILAWVAGKAQSRSTAYKVVAESERYPTMFESISADASF